MANILPGAGWSGATSQPAAIGTGDFADKPAVAQWTDVQGRDITTPYKVGVIACHARGVDRVEFAVAGGTWVSVTAVAANTDSEIHDYNVTIDPSDFGGNGPQEVRAVVYPVAGVPYVLQGAADIRGRNGYWPNVIPSPPTDEERWVSPSGNDSTGDGTEELPFLTILKAAQDIATAGGGVADGGTIYLAEGDYAIADTTVATTSRYLTITTAVGATRAATRITSYTNDGLNTNRLCLRNLTIRTYMSDNGGAGHYLWQDACHSLGDGQHSLTGPSTALGWLPNSFPWASCAYTDCIISDARFGPMMSTFIKGTLITRIGDDVFRFPVCVLNTTIDTVHPGGTGWHPDMVEITGAGWTHQRLVFCNVLFKDCNAQGVFVKGTSAVVTFKDSVFINTVIHKTDDVWVSQYDTNTQTDNVGHIHCSWVNFTQLVKESTIAGLYYDMCQFAAYTQTSPGVVDTDWFDRCHFTSGTQYGTNSSTGDPLWEDLAGRDFAPGTGSPLLARGAPAWPYDLYGQARSLTDSACGAIETSSAGVLGGGGGAGGSPEPEPDPVVTVNRLFAHFGP